MSHVFISYARNDGMEYAKRIELLLPEHGFKTWRDERGIDPTQDFTVEIERAIEESACVLACITPDTRREESYVRREIGYAMVQKKPVIVARFAEVPPPLAVVNHTWVDFFKGWESALPQLVHWLKSPGQSDAPPPAHVDDPHRAYLEALYKQIVRYLDKTVFSMLPGGSRAALIPLSAEDTPDAVDAPDEIEAQVLPMAFFDMAGVGDDPEPAHYYRNFHEAFAAHEGRLLLLGEPGGGKTTTLFAFARDAVATRLDDPAQPLPILAPIAMWNAEKQTPLAEWLAETIPALKEAVGRIVAAGEALLLLDGLDELGGERENPVTKELYDPRQRFMHIIPQNNQVLVSCRIKDYNAIGEKLAVRGAVTLQPLNDEQMRAYLRDLPDLWSALQADAELKEVARTPLLLSLFAFAFAGLDEAAKQLKDLSRGDLRDKIFETFFTQVYTRETRKHHAQPDYSIDELREKLGYLAMSNVAQLEAGRQIMTLESLEKLLKTSDIDHFVNLTTRLKLLVVRDFGTVQFSHLLLRDFFAFEYSVKSLMDPGVKFRSKAARALGVLGDLRAIASLSNALEDDNQVVRMNAADALGMLNSPDIVKPLISALNDADSTVRRIAAGELKRIGTPEALAAVKQWRREQGKID